MPVATALSCFSGLRALPSFSLITLLLAGFSHADDVTAPLPPLLHVTRYLTARDSTARLEEVPVTEALSSTHPQDIAAIRLEPRVRYQTMLGFGGAFTEAASTTLDKMSPARQEEILRACFDPVQGNGYTLCRTHINSCDFSLGNYSYDETPGDVALKDFSIDHDRKSLIPMIKRAQQISHNGFKLFASPWSPPAWMKTNGEMNNGGKLKLEDRDAWARYFVRYIQEYAKERIPIWAVTVQNEPAAKQVWDSCVYTGEEERDFVRDHLGPTFAQAGLDTHIIIWDHNRDIMYERAKAVLDDPGAAKYVWGIGFHWYVSDLFDNVQKVHDAWPNQHLLLTEGCQEGGPHNGEWAVGERYGHSMIEDLSHWAEGWVDWNMVLDQQGGPNHVGNYTSAPILADTNTGEIAYQSSYYYIGQFSRFIHPGAFRILSAPTSDSLETVAFVNPNGSTVAVVMNRTELPIHFELRLGAQGVQMDAPQHSIQTVMINP